MKEVRLIFAYLTLSATGATEVVENVKIRVSAKKAFLLKKVRWYVLGNEKGTVTGSLFGYLSRKTEKPVQTYVSTLDILDALKNTDVISRFMAHATEQSAVGFAVNVYPLELDYGEGILLANDITLAGVPAANGIPLKLCVELQGEIVTVSSLKWMKAAQ